MTPRWEPRDFYEFHENRIQIYIIDIQLPISFILLHLSADCGTDNTARNALCVCTCQHKFQTALSYCCSSSACYRCQAGRWYLVSIHHNHPSPFLLMTSIWRILRIANMNVGNRGKSTINISGKRIANNDDRVNALCLMPACLASISWVFLWLSVIQCICICIWICICSIVMYFSHLIEFKYRVVADGIHL